MALRRLTQTNLSHTCSFYLSLRASRSRHPRDSARHLSAKVVGWSSERRQFPSPHPSPLQTSSRRCPLTATAAKASCAAAATRLRRATPFSPPVVGSRHHGSRDAGAEASSRLPETLPANVAPAAVRVAGRLTRLDRPWRWASRARDATTGAGGTACISARRRALGRLLAPARANSRGRDPRTRPGRRAVCRRPPRGWRT